MEDRYNKMSCVVANPAMCLLLLLWLLLLVSPPIEGAPTNNSDVAIAMDEMKAASYYGFALLLDMLLRGGQHVPFPLHHLTFFMPTDTLLADDNALSAANLGDFLARHSIPLDLKFNNLLHFPTATLIPSSFPPYRLQVSNHGRSSYFLNNAQILTPNICRASISISCHGISQVLNASFSYSDTPPPPPSAAADVPSPWEPTLPPAPSDDASGRQTAPAPAPANSTSEGVANGAVPYATALSLLLCSMALGV